MPQTVGKNKQGHGYRFADLSRVMSFLDAQSVQYDQDTIWNPDSRNYEVITRLKNLGEDKWGEWKATTPIIAGARLSKEGKRILSDMQEFQSAETSARRMSLIIAANLVTTDDDAATAGGSQTTAATPGTVTAEQFSSIGKMLRNTVEGISAPQAATVLTDLVGRKVSGTGELSKLEASIILTVPTSLITEKITQALADNESESNGEEE